jgi:alpha-beta hydrolase superfamily lysophospholipase
VIVLVHGYGEHSGRYRHVILSLVDAGYAVYTLDHHGHGKSEGKRAYIDDFDHLISDLKHYFDDVQAAHPDRPIYLLGHSMGALLSLAFTLRYQDQLAGLIVSGAPLHSDQTVPPLMITAANILDKIVPAAPLADTAPVDGLSKDPVVRDGFRSDPLNYQSKMRVRTGVQINTTLRAVREQVSKLRLPVLILHGEADPICPPSGSRLIYDQAASADKTLKTYPGLLHEILNEPERAAVLADIHQWLDGQLAKRG